MTNSKIKGPALLLIPEGVLAVVDQFTKYLIVVSIPLNTGIPIVPGFLNLVHVHNTGGAFSIFAGPGYPWRRFVFIGLTVLVIAAIAYAYGKTAKKDNWTRTAYVFIAGGAIGNLIDRIRLQEVIDFIDVYISTWHWPAFNVADASISVGAVMLLASLVGRK